MDIINSRIIDELSKYDNNEKVLSFPVDKETFTINMQILIFMIYSYFVEEKKYKLTGYKMKEDEKTKEINVYTKMREK